MVELWVVRIVFCVFVGGVGHDGIGLEDVEVAVYSGGEGGCGTDLLEGFGLVVAFEVVHGVQIVVDAHAVEGGEHFVGIDRGWVEVNFEHHGCGVVWEVLSVAGLLFEFND